MLGQFPMDLIGGEIWQVEAECCDNALIRAESRGMTSPFDRLQLLGDLPQRAQQAVLPFAIAEDWQVACTHVSEAGGRSSYDWNVYAAELSVRTFASPLGKLVDSYGLAPTWLQRLLAVTSTARLGHVAGGADPMGQDFCTLYYATDDYATDGGKTG